VLPCKILVPERVLLLLFCDALGFFFKLFVVLLGTVKVLCPAVQFWIIVIDINKPLVSVHLYPKRFKIID